MKKKPGKKINAFTGLLDGIGKFTDKYSDTIALILIVGGSLLVAVAIGDLPDSGATRGYSFVYLKHPLTLRVGLIAIVAGFISQLSDNLIITHKLSRKKVFWPLTLIFFFLLLLVLGG